MHDWADQEHCLLFPHSSLPMVFGPQHTAWVQLMNAYPGFRLGHVLVMLWLILWYGYGLVMYQLPLQILKYQGYTCCNCCYRPTYCCQDSLMSSVSLLAGQDAGGKAGGSGLLHSSRADSRQGGPLCAWRGHCGGWPGGHGLTVRFAIAPQTLCTDLSQ